MRIEAIDLLAYGPFHGVRLDLSGGDEGLHFIYGPNEAGKSSALRALKHLLYGIPERTEDAFLWPYDKLRIGATLRKSDGTRQRFVRLKRRKNALMDPDEKTPIAERVLAEFLSAVDETRFSTMFGIDHASLVAGGEEIVRGGGELGEALFAAGAGITDLRTVRQKLEGEADALFKPAGTRPAINQTLTALKEAKKALRESQASTSEWIKQDAALREARQRLAEAENELSEVSRQHQRLERYRDALPVIARRKRLEAEQAALGDVPRLPDDFAEQRREAVTQLDVARKAEQAACEAIEEIRRQIDALRVPDELLAESEAIEELYRQLGAYRKAQSDRPGLIARRDQLEQEAAAILQRLRPDLSLEMAESLRLTRPEKTKIRKLAERHVELSEKCRQAEAEVREAEMASAEAEAELAGLDAPADIGPLREALTRAQSVGDLDGQLAADGLEIDNLREQAQVELHRLPLWSGTLEELEPLPLPSSETVDRFEQQLTEAAGRLERFEEGTETTRQQAAEVGRQIDELQMQGDVPTEEELTASRRLRDSGWQLVRQAWEGGETNADELRSFLDRFPGHDGLASAYEEAVRRADDVADRLRREQNRVARLAGLRADQLAIQTRAAAMADNLAEARRELGECQNQWQACWQAAGIEPLPPREMRAWLAAQRELRQRSEGIRQRRAACRRLLESLDGHRRELKQHLADMGRDPGPEEEPLAATLGRCRTLLDQTDATSNARRQLQRDLDRYQGQLAEARNEAKALQAELAAWAGQWAGAMERLGLAADTSRDVADAFVEESEQLLALLKQAGDFAGRIDDIARDAEAFHRDVARLTARVASDLGPEESEQAVEQLVSRLRQALADRQRRDTLREQLQQQEAKRDESRQNIGKATARLSALCQEAGCEGPEQLPDVERASAARVRLEELRADPEQRLVSLAAGGTVEELVSEVEAVDPDGLPAELEQLAARMTKAREACDRQRAEITRAETLLSTMDSSSAPARKAEEIEDLLAKIEPDVQQYLCLRLASAVLREGIERYRRKNQGPVLERANELFRRLTVDSFRELMADVDDRGENVLVGIRPDGGRVAPAGMSDGTCDQLYLALRLASLETWLERHEPLPFIVDDVLIRFDNQRAAATLRVLADLSRRTQVIFFTHHQHLLELAEAELDAEVFQVLRL